MTIRNLILAALLVCLTGAGVSGQRCKNVKVTNVKSIFAIAPSPAGAIVLFYGSAEEAEGEIVAGKPFMLRLGQIGNDMAKELTTPEASNPPLPVWQPDGSSVYFETDDGIYQLRSSTDESPKLLWKGPSEGMAISSDGLFLAFWRVGKGTDTLILYDLKKNSEVRSWPIPDRFESDKSGWDIAFAHNGQALYARTYDETRNSPLKRFEITSGKVSIVSSDCYAIVAGKDSTYFIAVSGEVRTLQKVTASGRPSLVAKDFTYDSLSIGGNPRWLVSQNYRTKEAVLFDTEEGAIKSIGKCDSAAVMSDGKILEVHGSEITVGDASCKPE